MKPAAASFLYFLLLAAAVSAEVVLDSKGHFMRNGGDYYLTSSTPIGGGGIKSSAPIWHGDSNLCSLAVVSVLYSKGWAVTISTPAKIAFITTSVPLNLAFAYLPPNVCADSPNWVVVESVVVESHPLGEAVMLGGAQESGAATVAGSFYIKTYDSDEHYYKLVFREEGKDECRNIGLKVDSAGRRRLVVTDEEPLVFKFDKASSNSDLSMVV